MDLHRDVTDRHLHRVVHHQRVDPIGLGVEERRHHLGEPRRLAQDGAGRLHVARRLVDEGLLRAGVRDDSAGTGTLDQGPDLRRAPVCGHLEHEVVGDRLHSREHLHRQDVDARGCRTPARGSPGHPVGPASSFVLATTWLNSRMVLLPDWIPRVSAAQILRPDPAQWPDAASAPTFASRGGRVGDGRRRAGPGAVPPVAAPPGRGRLPVGGPSLAARAGQHVRHLLGGPTAADHRALQAQRLARRALLHPGRRRRGRRAVRARRGGHGASSRGVRRGARRRSDRRVGGRRDGSPHLPRCHRPRRRQGRDPRPAGGDGVLLVRDQRAHAPVVAARGRGGGPGRARGRAQAEPLRRPRLRRRAAGRRTGHVAAGASRLPAARGRSRRRRPAAGAGHRRVVPVRRCPALDPRLRHPRLPDRCQLRAGQPAVEHDRQQDPHPAPGRARLRPGDPGAVVRAPSSSAAPAGPRSRRRRSPPCWPSTAPG